MLAYPLLEIIVCWDRPGSKILGSVTLGDNVFVGANAVVTHDMPSNSIVAGIPAKVISMNGLQSTELVRQHK